MNEQQHAVSAAPGDKCPSEQLPQIVVTCDGCGACCMGMGVPPFDEHGVNPVAVAEDDQDIEYQALPAYLKAEVDAAWERGTASFAGKPCIWLDLDTQRCKHYEFRPVVCAEFDPGNDICLEDIEIMKRKDAEQ